MKPYSTFLETKQQHGIKHGFEPLWIPDSLYDFQGAAAAWGIEKGRGALFLDCGMGKTPIQLVWAENVARFTKRRILVTTPLAVSRQTVSEAEKFGVYAQRSQDGKLPDAQIVVTNYERLHHFNPEDFAGVVCDESSILKNFDGKRKAEVTEFLRKVPYRLLCTATAAPNDYIELGTSSEALGELGHMDMLAMFFRNDQNTCDTKTLHRRPIAYGGPRSAGWRFKGHAETPYWRWVCTWARAGRKPSDLGEFENGRFVLPDLIEREHIVETRTLAEGMLFPMAATNMQEERAERRRTIEERCEMAAQLVAGTCKPAVVWCHLNDEGDMLDKLIPDGEQIAGATPDERKEELYEAFGTGQLRVLTIKDKIGAWGLNWQHCAHVVRFATHSFESHYQAVRRCWRFGQKSPVTVDLVVTEGEQGVKENLQRKSAAADRMFTELVSHMRDAQRVESHTYEGKVEVPAWL